MKEDSFENQWKEAFENASHTPPPEIWDRVEAELGKKKKSGFIVWENPFLLSGAAAAVLFVLGTVFLFEHTAKVESLSNAVKKDEIADKEGQEIGITGIIKKEESILSNEEPILNNEPHVKIREKSSLKKLAVSSEKWELNRSMALNEDRESSKALSSEKASSDSHGKAEEMLSSYAGTLMSESNLIMDRLSFIPYSESNNAFQMPVERIDLDLLEDKINLPKYEKTGWFGLVAANAPFNPNFSTPGLQQQAAAAIMDSENTFFQSGKGGADFPDPSGSYTNTSRRDAQSSFKIGSAISYGIGIGKKIKKRLGLESGIRFTSARSSHVYNVYSVDKVTGNSNSFSLENYVLPSNSNTSDVLISVNGSSQITYNFLSIPVLLNYNLLNMGRFNVNAVGGLSTEILLSGRVAHPKEVNQSFNARNSNFKAVNLAGLGGVRLSYSLTNQLALNLGGTYQHFLTSGIESSSSASFRPSMLGLTMGVSVKR